MADDTLKPMTDQDVVPPAADPLVQVDAFEPANPLNPVDALQPSDPRKGKDTDGGDPLPSPSGADSGSGDSNGDTSGEDTPPVGARQAISDNVAKLKSEAGDRARSFVDEGKARATGALDQLVQMLNDAADQVDGKLGSQYGEYARSAAGTVQGFSSTLNERNVDELLDDARELVRKSPAAAIGTAAAVGFVLARLLSAGLDQRDKT